MKNHWEINILDVTSVTSRTLIKPCENEHFRWSALQEAGPCWDCSRCRRARHWAPWATKCGNTHFHCNALVAPSWQLRRPTGQHAHKCRHLSVKIANTGRYEVPWCEATLRKNIVSSAVGKETTNVGGLSQHLALAALHISSPVIFQR